MPSSKYWVKSGGCFYKGYAQAVAAGAGDTTLDMTVTTRGCAVTAVTVIVDTYGAGDYFKLEHLDADSVVLDTIAETVYNVGAGVAIHFDLVALQKMTVSHKLRLTYTSVAGQALNVYTIVERIV